MDSIKIKAASDAIDALKDLNEVFRNFQPVVSEETFADLVSQVTSQNGVVAEINPTTKIAVLSINLYDSCQKVLSIAVEVIEENNRTLAKLITESENKLMEVIPVINSIKDAGLNLLPYLIGLGTIATVAGVYQARGAWDERKAQQAAKQPSSYTKTVCWSIVALLGLGTLGYTAAKIFSISQASSLANAIMTNNA